MAMEKEMPVTTMWMGMVQAWGCGGGWEICRDEARKLGVSELGKQAYGHGLRTPKRLNKM